MASKWMSTGASVLSQLLSCALLGLLVSLAHCRGRAGGETEPEVARALCASACASLTASLGDAKTRLTRQTSCVELCAAVRGDAARAGCQNHQDQALRCLSTAQIASEQPASTRSALEQGSGIGGCQAEFLRLLQCSAPCREAGVVRSGARRLHFQGKTLEVKAEHVSLGCEPAPRELGRHSPPGAPCEHFSVCSQTRCPCPGSNAAYAARACVEGRCAPAELSCALVPTAVGHDECPAR